MQVRHNTELLEQAVDLMVKRSGIPALEAEALAHEKMERATAFRRLATGGAIAIAAIGLGIGAALFLNSQFGPTSAGIDTATSPAEKAQATPDLSAHRVEQSEKPPELVKAETEEAVEPDPAPPAPATDPLAEITPPKPDIVTIDFTKFASRSVTHLGTEWNLMVGHYFANESDEMWQYAWCYTNRNIRGVDVSVNLLNRPSPQSAPVGPVSHPETLMLAGLNDETALELATRCPWLDGRSFSIGEITPSTDRITAPAPTSEILPAVEDNSLVTAEGFDAIGNDLPNMPLQRVSLEQCRDACSLRSSCVAATYNKKYRACFLKSDANFLVAEKDAIAFAKGAVRSRLQKSNLEFEPKTELVGQPKATRRDTYPNCIISCAADPTCEGFNYRQKDQSCSLMEAISRARSNPDVTSGRRAGSDDTAVDMRPTAQPKVPAPRPDGFFEMLIGTE